MYHTLLTTNLGYYLFTKPLITFQMTILIFWVQFQNPRETGASFLTVGVFKCDLAHRRSVAVLCMLYKIRCNPLHILHCAFPAPYVPVRVTPHIGTLIMHLLAAEPHSIAGLLYPCQYLYWTTLVTPYSMVFDWRVSRRRLMPFYWPSCSLHFCLFLFFLFLFSFYGRNCGVFGLILY